MSYTKNLVSTKNLVIDQGATFYERMALVDSENYPVNEMLGWVVFGQVQKTYSSANITAAFDVFHRDNAGNVEIRLEANVTAQIEPGRYVYNLFGRLYEKTEKLKEGIVTVNPSTVATGMQFTGYAGNTVPQFLVDKITDISTGISNTISLNRASNVIVQLKNAAILSNTYGEFRDRILSL
jgi:hypothetical protein